MTDPAYARPHDLVDLQLLWNAGPDVSAVREFCLRTFAFRRVQEWPPLPLRGMDGREAAYRVAREETEIRGHSLVLEGVDAARNWLQQVIASIAAAPRKHRGSD